MTTPRTEPLYRLLDKAAAKEAVALGATMLSVADAIDAVTEGMNIDQLQEAAALILGYIAELDVPEAAE